MFREHLILVWLVLSEVPRLSCRALQCGWLLHFFTISWRSLKQWYASVLGKGIDANKKERFFFKSKVLEYSKIKLSTFLFQLHTFKLQGKSFWLVQKTWTLLNSHQKLPVLVDYNYSAATWLKITEEGGNKIPQLICAETSLHSDFLIATYLPQALILFFSLNFFLRKKG